MKYFLTLEECGANGGTCYHEFYRGKWDEENMVFWSSDSMYIHDDLMYELCLDVFFEEIIGKYNIAGVNTITKTQWEHIFAEAENRGGALFDAIKEINAWAGDNFMTNNVFTVLGI